MGFLSFSDANYTFFSSLARDHRGSDRMVIGFTTTYAISSYYN
jgi:hypothetical protein